MPTIPGNRVVYQPLAKAVLKARDVFQAELEGGLVDVVTAGDRRSLSPWKRSYTP